VAQRHAGYGKGLEMRAVRVLHISAAQRQAPVDIKERGIPFVRRRRDAAVFAARGRVAQQVDIVGLGTVATRT
jgi:hypothetical protein